MSKCRDCKYWVTKIKASLHNDQTIKTNELSNPCENDLTMFDKLRGIDYDNCEMPNVGADFGCIHWVAK